MVYFLNLDGTMTLAEPQRVFQGSNNVNTVYVLSAIAPPTALEISFTLPSGLTTAYYPMIYNGATDEYTVPNTTTTVYLRSFLLTSNITAEVGTVGVSVNAVYSNADGTTGNQTSFTGSFNVEYSSIPESVTTGTADELQQALDLLSQYYTQQQAIITGGTNGEYLQSQGNNQLPVWTSFDMDFVTVNRAQSFSEEQKTQARKNIGAASQTSLDNDIANCVQIKAQSLTNEQKAQARTNIDVYSKNEIDDSVVKYSSAQSLTDTQKAQARTNIGAEGSADSQYTVKVVEQTFTDAQKSQARKNIGALSSADLSVWSQRTEGEEDLNTLADAGSQKAYISRYSPSTANAPGGFGSVISFRNSASELTQLAMKVRPYATLFYRGSDIYGAWKEVDMIAQQGDNYIVYTSGLKIQWGEANIPSQIAVGTVITPTISLPIAMTTETYKIMGICTNSNVNFGYDNRQASSFVLGIRNLGSAAVTTSSVYSWVVIGY